MRMDLKFRFTQQNDRNSDNRPSLPQGRPSEKSGLSKYKKKTVAGNAPDNQFKKYML